MTVFLVWKGSYERAAVVAVFSTKQQAEAYLNEEALDSLISSNPDAEPVSDDGTHLHYDKWDDYGIQELPVDALPPINWVCWGKRPKCIGTDNAEGYKRTKQSRVTAPEHSEVTA